VSISFNLKTIIEIEIHNLRFVAAAAASIAYRVVVKFAFCDRHCLAARAFLLDALVLRAFSMVPMYNRLRKLHLRESRTVLEL